MKTLLIFYATHTTQNIRVNVNVALGYRPSLWLYHGLVYLFFCPEFSFPSNSLLFIVFQKQYLLRAFKFFFLQYTIPSVTIVLQKVINTNSLTESN